jgi:hypothetical protein
MKTSASALARCATAFWFASLPGFAAHGWVLATAAAGGLAEGGGAGRAETAGAALTLAALEAVVLGVPSALGFAVALLRSRRPRWAAAVAPALVVAAALAAGLAACAWAFAGAGAGWLHGPAVHVALGAATAGAGAVAAGAVAPARRS